MTGWDGRRARQGRDCGRAGDRVAPIRRDVGRHEDDLGGEGRRRPLRPVGERAHVRLVPRHPATPRRPDRAGGVEKDVTFVEADADLEARIDEAYRQKYRRYARSIVDSTLTPRARSAALRLVPPGASASKQHICLPTWVVCFPTAFRALLLLGTLWWAWSGSPWAVVAPVWPGFTALVEVRVRVGQRRGVAARRPAAPGVAASSPPGALEGAVGATGLVEGVERGHVLGGEREVEDASVLDDALAVGGLRQDDQVALQAPAQEDLGRRAPTRSATCRRAGRGDGGRCPAGCRPRARRCAPRTPRAGAGGTRRGLNWTWLMTGGVLTSGSSWSSSARLKFETPIERAKPRSRAFHPRPRPPRGRRRPVDDVEVDVVDVEALEAALDLGLWVVRSGQNLVVMKTSSRGTPLSRSAGPTLASLP